MNENPLLKFCENQSLSKEYCSYTGRMGDAVKVEDVDSKKEETLELINFHTIKEEPYTVEEDCHGDAASPGHFQFVSCNTERDVPVDMENESINGKEIKSEDTEIWSGDSSNGDLSETLSVDKGSESDTVKVSNAKNINNETVYPCDKCKKYFAGLECLSRHKLSKHGVKKYHCVICNKDFSHSSTLSQHKLTHTSIKKYECEVCNKTFSQSRSLCQHKQIHNGVKKYHCDVCNKAFLQSCSLSRHKMIHSGTKNYQCDICDRRFTHSHTLARHKVTHSGIKKYHCEVCKKTFAQLRILHEHKKLHSSIKRHRCEVCDKSFFQSSSLSHHKRTHSVIKEKPKSL